MSDVRKIAGVNEGQFFDPSWSFHCRVIWPCRPEHLAGYAAAAFPGSKVDIPKGKFCGLTLVFDNGETEVYVIALEKKPINSLQLSSLAHEAFHVTNYVLDDRGMKLSYKTQEAYCYLLDSIFKRCLDLTRAKIIL